jgi:uncharacterized protein
MATSLLALLDDIATLLDDVSVMTKVAAKKTAGVLGDDLALNANQVAGVRADRELPVVWAVAKGSAINKLILVPLALLIATVAPKLVTPLLMLGGLYLCFEGVEKIAHKFLHSKAEDEAHHQELLAANAAPDLVEFEKQQIKGAVRTDFILSAEIIVISLGTMAATATFTQKLSVLVLISVLMTVGVYGLVAGIVKLDDAGLHLVAKGGASAKLGNGLLWFAPVLMKFLSIFGTAAMFLVGGGILVHGVPALYSWTQSLEKTGFMGLLASSGVAAVFGILCGIVALVAVIAVKKLRGK